LMHDLVALRATTGLGCSPVVVLHLFLRLSQ
jgi:hypothetical protein